MCTLGVIVTTNVQLTSVDRIRDAELATEHAHLT